MSSKKTVDRRVFLRTSAGVAVGAAAVSEALKASAAEAVKEIEVDDRPFKIGLIGCGSQAVFNLLPAALRIPGITFPAVCDIVPARAKQAAQQVKNKTNAEPKVYDDYNKLIAEVECDAVMIVTPLITHRAIVEAAFKAGRHVFCEKCMAYSIEDCKAMLKAQIKAGKKILQIGHHLRYHPLYYFAKDHYIKRGLLGEKITNVHIQWNRNGTWRRQPPAGTYDFKKWGFDEPDHLWNWRLYRKYSGGLMTELASHQLDVVNWFLDDAPPQRVMGVGKIDFKDGRTIFDNCHLVYEYPNDVQVTCECICTNSYSPFSMQPYEMFQGDRGTLVMAHLSRYVGLYFLEPGAKEELWMPMATRKNLGFENIVHENHKKFIVLNGTPSPGSKTEMIGSLPLEGLVNVPEARILKPTYEIELINFKMSCLDTTRPACDGFVGLKSAIPAIRGYEAMEKGQPIEIAKSDYSLV